MDARRGGAARSTLVTGLVLGAVGLGAAWLLTQPRPPFPAFPAGVLILLAGSAIAGFEPSRRVGGLVGLAAVGLVATRLLASGRIDELWFTGGVAIGLSRWVQVLGLLVAVMSAVVLLIGRSRPGGKVARRRADPIARREGRARVAQIVGLLMLSAIGAELLAAYGDNTGRPAELLFAVVFFAALYGAPALLIREAARRNGWGWPSIVLFAGALGIVQPTLIDQALFSMDYQGIEGWSRSLQGTFIEPLGFSATNALNFIPGHVIYSFCAPIAVAEAWRPHTAHTPWLGRRATAAAALAYLLAAVLILTDPESHSASAIQIVASIVAAGLCAGAAIILGRRRVHHRRGTRHAPPLWATVTGSFLVLTTATAVPETWTGAAITTTVLAAGAAAVAQVSRSPDWRVHHAAAVATGALLHRGVLAFTYYPLIGDTTAVRKYTHNVVMLAIVGVAAWLALRKLSSSAGEHPSDLAEHRPAHPVPRPLTTPANVPEPLTDPEPVDPDDRR